MRRRKFIARGMLVLAAGATRASAASSPDKENGISRVLIARDPAYSKTGTVPDEKVAGEMIERLVREITGAGSVKQSWRKLLAGSCTVGLKPNCLAGRGVSSSPAFVNALCRQLLDSLPEVEKIYVWERSNSDLKKGGFEISTRGKIWCLGNDRAGYGRDLVVEGSIGSLVSSIVLDKCEALINLPVLKDHGIVGVSVGMKNYYGAVHNPNKYHLNRGDPYVADLNCIEKIRGRNVLTLCEAFTAQYEGGPPFKPQWSWPAGMILASTDPVALDRVGWKMIEQKRAEHGLPSLASVGREPTYILTAADSRHRLGCAELDEIQEKVLS